MSYTCNDQSDRLTELLIKKGYAVYHGDGHNSAHLLADLPDHLNGDQNEENYDASIDGFWFTWGDEGTDIECGETWDSETAAWTDAMEHFFRNAEIQTLPVDDVEVTAYWLTDREHATVLAALRCLQQVDSECAGDIPEDLQDIASNGGTLERMMNDEIDDLCLKLNCT